MQTVPLQAVPNQTVAAALGGQQCQINVYQTMYGVFMDLYVGAALVIGGVLCEDDNRIVRSKYLGFQGDFIFDDTQGMEDPIYTGLGARFQLVYLAPADLSALGFAA